MAAAVEQSAPAANRSGNILEKKGYLWIRKQQSKEKERGRSLVLEASRSKKSRWCFRADLRLGRGRSQG